MLLLADLTLGTEPVGIPQGPVDGKFTEERPQSFATFPVIGSAPHVQVTAPGNRTLSFSLELWGKVGDDFYRKHIRPLYGFNDALDTFRPHLCQIAWGNSLDLTFSGRIIGQPPTENNMGAISGEVFSRVFSVTLIEIDNSRPVVFDGTTGKQVRQSKTYTTVQGDTVFSVAKKHLTTVEEIAALNGGGVRFDLKPGTKLQVPLTGGSR